ncbi:MAG: hypothetical protein LH702_13800 [Phormidesmis sp. CAN_BIN44]|nr:hypothetical protein [Phormidesmis sp. CAN_BIN44]
MPLTNKVLTLIYKDYVIEIAEVAYSDHFKGINSILANGRSRPRILLLSKVLQEKNQVATPNRELKR